MIKRCLECTEETEHDSMLCPKCLREHKDKCKKAKEHDDKYKLWAQGKRRS